MPSSYALADKETESIVETVMQRHHTDLDSVAAKIDILFAFRDPEDETGAPAMLKEGHRVLSQSKKISLKDRVKGMGDCEIILDGDAWGNMDKLEKLALVDHALEHFEAKRDKEGNFTFDDINRPEIKIRNHDRVIRFFDGVAQRHGISSIEAKQLQSMLLREGTTYLPFVKTPEEETAE